MKRQELEGSQRELMTYATMVGSSTLFLYNKIFFSFMEYVAYKYKLYKF